MNKNNITSLEPLEAGVRKDIQKAIAALRAYKCVHGKLHRTRACKICYRREG